MNKLKKDINRNTIKRQLILNFSSLMLIVLLIITFVAIFISKSALLNNSQELLKSFAAQTGKDIDDLINKEIEKVELVTMTPILSDDNATREDKLKYLAQVVENQGYKKAALIDTNGTCYTILGEVVDVSDKEYFKINMTGEGYFSAPTISKADGGLQISITAPIIKNNKVTEIVFFSKDAKDFSDITNRVTFGKSGSAYIVDENGTNIANNDIEKVINKVNRIEDAKTNQEYEELAAVTERMITGENGTGAYSFNGTVKYVGFAPIESKGWAIGVTVEVEDLLGSIDSLKLAMIYLGIASVVIMILLTFVIAKNISKRLNRLKDEVEKIATGDFTETEIRDYKGDEITDIYISLGKTKKSVSDIVTSINSSAIKVNSECIDISEMAERIVTGTQTINQAIEDSTASTESQADELTKINLELEKFDKIINRNSDYIFSITDKSEEISNKANSSQLDMNNLTESIKTLSNSFESFSKEIQDMKINMNTINDIITLINSISDQTNLLALNAAIEAARAGEAGKGFSVVADEIRNLAEQSKESTKSIHSIISNVIENTEVIVKASETINNEIIQSEQRVGDSVRSFEEIAKAVSEINPMVNNVSSSFKEIIDEKNIIIEKVEESAASSEEIAAISEEVLASTNEFVISIEAINNAIESLKDSSNDMSNEINKFRI